MSFKFAEVRVTELTRYPVKAAAGIIMEQAVLGKTGFRLDRHWMIVDSQGNFQSQRNRPELALLKVETGKDGEIIVSHPNQANNCHIVHQYNGPPLEVKLHDHKYAGIDCGKTASDWISGLLGSDALGKKFRIVQFDQSRPRWVKGLESEGYVTEFADAYPYLLCTQESLDNLNLQLQNQQLPPVLMNRFRPNIVITGTDALLAAFSEYQYDSLTRIDGNISFKLIKPCKRCTVTTVEQSSGTVPVRGEPLKTLSALGASTENAAFFGMNMVLDHGAQERIKTGDIFYLTK